MVGADDEFERITTDMRDELKVTHVLSNFVNDLIDNELVESVAESVGVRDFSGSNKDTPSVISLTEKKTAELVATETAEPSTEDTMERPTARNRGPFLRTEAYSSEPRPTAWDRGPQLGTEAHGSEPRPIAWNRGPQLWKEARNSEPRPIARNHGPHIRTKAHNLEPMSTIHRVQLFGFDPISMGWLCRAYLHGSDVPSPFPRFNPFFCRSQWGET